MRLSALCCGAVLILAALPARSLADHIHVFDGALTSTATSTVVTSQGYLHIQGTVAGHGTVIGAITGSFDYYVNPTDGTFAGTLTKIAVNGDEVHEVFAGQFNADFTASKGIFLIVGGTGQFKHAGGIGVFAGQVTSAATIDIDYEGLILLPK